MKATKMNLVELAQLHGTDKWGSHYYAKNYEQHFGPFREKKINLLEIGIGGEGNIAAGGQSLRMWRDFFPNATIYGLDIYDKKAHEEDRIKIIQGSQNDVLVLETIVRESGGLDLVVDDGSHVNSHVIKSFQTLFPLLNDNGIYVVEDLQTSYWSGYGGATVFAYSGMPSMEKTSMGFFKSLVDGLNYEEFNKPGYQPSYFDAHITSITFYHNMVFIQKGDNNEGSNFVRNNVLPDCFR